MRADQPAGDEERRLEIQLAGRERLLGAIFEAEPECVYLLGPDGAVRMMNRAGLAIIEADSLGQVAGQSMDAFVQPCFRAAFQALHGRVLQGESGRLEFRIAGLKGACPWVEMSAAPLRDEEGSVTAVLGVTRDVTARKEAEEKLRASESNLATAQALVHLGSWDVDLVTRAGEWSDEMFRLLYREPSAGVPAFADFLELIHPEDRARTQQARDRFPEITEPLSFTYRTNPANGPVRHISATIQVFRDSQGRPVRTTGTALDVTAREQAEMVSRRLAAIMQASDDAIIGMDLDGVVTDWNGGAEVIFGYPAAEITGKPITLLIPGDRKKEAEAILERVRRGETVSHFETVRQTRAGTLRDVSITESPIRGAAGQIIGVSKIARDITVRKRHEEEIARLSRLYAALSHVDQAIVRMPDRLELFGKVCRTLVDQAGFRMAWIGWADAETGRLVPVAAQGDGSDYLKKVEIYVDDRPEGRGPGGIAFREERPYICNDMLNDPVLLPWRSHAECGGFRSVATFPIRLEGRVRGVLAVYAGQEDFFRDEEIALLLEAARDISFALDNLSREAARASAEEKVRQLNNELEHRVIDRTAQLESANRELEAFSYSVSHDLRAPLRAVNGLAGIVLDEYGEQIPEGARHYLERIRNRGSHMGELIDDLLAFSQLGRQPLKRLRVDMGSMVGHILDDLAPQYEGRHIDFQTGALPDCWGDPTLLRQVWTNLLSNAIKYTRMRETARIEIGCLQAGADNIYHVRDNGTGFEMKYAHKLFGVFQRLHRAEDFDGTGVGLAIVRRIVNRHGGRVWAEGENEKGATFYFTVGTETQP